MCQFNYTIVKSKKSVSYLRNHGYSCLDIFPGGYKAFGGNKPGYCDCGSMVGSQSFDAKNKDIYPSKLPADNSHATPGNPVFPQNETTVEILSGLKPQAGIPAGIPRPKSEGISWPYIRSIREFLYYRRIFKRLLEFEPYICFTHIFDKPGELTTVKTLRLSELECRDLALLGQDQVLKIRR